MESTDVAKDDVSFASPESEDSSVVSVLKFNGNDTIRIVVVKMKML